MKASSGCSGKTGSTPTQPETGRLPKTLLKTGGNEIRRRRCARTVIFARSFTRRLIPVFGNGPGRPGRLAAMNRLSATLETGLDAGDDAALDFPATAGKLGKIPVVSSIAVREPRCFS